ncbi:restriction endonuclease subunit S [Roseimarinus sediminis]|uniref:restriction endonuclease subunit S n=1 Tax=Roseimarinus sediminis TaxID=1610899 RepID=UPI003D22F929
MLEKLGSVCDFQGGTQPPKKEWSAIKLDGYIRMLQIRDFTQPKEEFIGYVKDKATLKKCNSDDILIGRYGASVGKILTGLSGAYNVAIIKTVPDDERLDRKYLYHFLINPRFQNFIKNIGGRAAQAGFNKTDIIDYPLYVPKKETQLHIANILTKAERLIAQRKESIRLLDEYLKSVFLEMFGDPVRNEKSWTKNNFGNYILRIIAGSSYGGEQKEELNDDEYGVLKVSAVTWGIFNSKEFKVVKKSNLRGEIISPQKGDLLFSRANTKELVGATCIVDKDYPKLFLPDKLWNIVLDENKLQKSFIHFLFKHPSFKMELTKGATGTSGSMLNISMEKLRKVNVPVPPLELQTKFVQIVEKTEALKTQYQQSLQELENLYGSLSQKAFKGELSLKDEGLLMAAEPETKYGV